MLITNTEALSDYRSEYRIWQGIPGIERTKKGRLFVSFYSGGIGEEIGNFACVIMSDDGVRFSQPVAVAYEEGNRCFDPGLWIDPLGRLWFWWARYPEFGVFASICEDPDAEVLSWSEPFKIGEEIMMNKPTVLSTGEWLFPISAWEYGIGIIADDPLRFDERDRGTFVYVTKDQGKTFEKLGKASIGDNSYDEHMILEQEDGSLSAYIRILSAKGGIGLAKSYDRGKTWAREDCPIHGPGSRFCIRRLSSGHVLLVNHVDYTGRNNLTALLSEDDGKTWPYRLLLDERTPVSYPDMTEGSDGFLYIVYDRERSCGAKTAEEAEKPAREILFAKITEEDIIKGSLTNPESRLKLIADKLGKYEGDFFGKAEV